VKTDFKKLIQTSLAILALCLCLTSSARASFIDLGTLDIAPVSTATIKPPASASAAPNNNPFGGNITHGDASSDPNWFIEYLRPGEKKQEQIRISNFGPTAKNLEIYVSDAISAVSESKTNPPATTAISNTNKITSSGYEPSFYAKPRSEKSDDIAEWIHLPAKKITLEAGESKILSVNIITPKNAGVGLHTAAIIVKETAETAYGKIAIEKGIRVYMNILGEIINDARPIAAALFQEPSAITLRVTTANNGTVDNLAQYKLSAYELFGNNTISAENVTRIKPGTVGTNEITITKPTFGIYSIYASNGQNTSYLGTTLFIPPWTLLAFLALVLLATRHIAQIKPSLRTINAPRPKKQFFAQPTKNVYNQAIQLDFNSVVKKIFTFNQHAYQTALVYFGIFAILVSSTLYFSITSRAPAIAQIINTTGAHTYRLTIKWGNFRGLTVPNSYRKNWEGKIDFTNATVNIAEYLDFEQTDKAEVTSSNSSILYKTVTGPDNDGIVVNLESTSDDIPIVNLTDKLTGESYAFAITDYLNMAAVYPSGLFATYFKTDTVTAQASPKTLEELAATPELFATSSATLGNAAPKFSNLFLQDLPATPEALADFILHSSYVDDISIEKKTKKIKTDPLLIQALAATPEVLAEVSASPELNFIFIPNNPVKFPPQEFSFNESKVTFQNLGPIIFVQNKPVNWNSYLSATDFASLRDNQIIPAYNLTVIPGEPLIISKDNGAKIQTGKPRAFKDSSDKTMLLSVEPGNSSQQIFILNPQLKFTIPAGTLPGRYRGVLTLTSL